MKTKDLLRSMPSDIYDIPNYPIKVQYNPNQDAIWFMNHGECVVAIKLYGGEYRYTIYSNYINNEIKLLADRLRAYMDLLGLKEKRATMYEQSSTIPSFHIKDLEFTDAGLLQKMSGAIKDALLRSTNGNTKKHTKRNIFPR